MDKTWEANADLSTLQFCFIIPATGVSPVQMRVANATANARTIGIQQNKPNAAGIGTVVRLSGISKLKVDGSGTPIVVGDIIEATTNGVGIKCVTDKHNVGAIALEPSSAANDIIEVKIVEFHGSL
jgi:hypothetical protein